MSKRQTKREKLDEIEKTTRDYLIYLKSKYPEKDIAEYTRLVSQLETFLAYGFWSRHLEDNNASTDT